jgi:hypothetical protein
MSYYIFPFEEVPQNCRVILYPRITSNGILMIDDYGTWEGSKKAVDEYFEKNGYRPFLQYIDHTGRLGIKT